jgi:amidase/aspartyl-tRNA(Asn)/glutamyl-tRNA(Gln) amidotransferase subunit A
VFSWLPTEPELIKAFERVANTIAPLAGVPYALKDLFFTAGQPLQAGSGFPPGVLPVKPRDGKMPHVLRGLGMVLAGKTQLHEFAYGLTGENITYGDCEHPRFPGRTSGGSSSGSAAAVAAGIVPFAIGTDTGGSIRVPAAFCGLYGFRMPANHSWMEDAFPLAASFDTPGWFTQSASDLFVVNRYLLGKTAEPERKPRGCSLDFAALGLDAEPAIVTAISRVIGKYAPPADEATAKEIRAAFSGATEAYSILQSTEAYAAHAAWLDSHRSSYDPAVWARIDRGRHWTVAQQDAARAKMAALRLTWQSFFLTYDYLVMPATPFPALTKADCTQENRNQLLALTTPASLGGLPVLTVPVMLGSGLSTGLQIVVSHPQSPAINAILKPKS